MAKQLTKRNNAINFKQNGKWPQKKTPPPPPQLLPSHWLPPNLPSMMLQQTKGGIKGPPKTADPTGKGTKTSLNKERRIFGIVLVKGKKSRIIIEQRLRNPNSCLSTKSINHANHQAWLQLFQPPNLLPKMQGITIDPRPRNSTSRLSKQSINHANHQSWPLLSKPPNPPSSLLVTYVSIQANLPSLNQNYYSPVPPGLCPPLLIICPQPDMHQSSSGKKRAIQ